ncbi:MAG: type III-B CRISPR module RAMP protein Cmr1 [Moorellales bacterium]
MEIEATYRVTSPLFLGGAEPTQAVELRPPSLKGLLRFWLRAVAWPRLGSWQAVAEVEERLFGSTRRQAAWHLSVRGVEGLVSVPAGELWERQYGLAYLGYGVVEPQKIKRPYFREGGRFRLCLATRQTSSDTDDTDRRLLLAALTALGLLGGAGARARKGFGSLCLERLRCDREEVWEAPTTKEDLIGRLRTFLGALAVPREGSLPPYTAVGPQTKVWLVGQDRDARRLLDWLGRELLRYRSYGRAPRGRSEHQLPWGEVAEQNFADDHDLVIDFLQGQRVSRPPRRVVFGLPHNYFFGSTGRKVEIKPAGTGYDRRASPLFTHIHGLASGEYTAVMTLLPAAFLPSGQRLVLETSRRRSAQVACRVDYSVIEDFFRRPAIAGRAVSVWPES